MFDAVNNALAHPLSSVVLVAGGSVLGWFLKKKFGDTKTLETAARDEAQKVVDDAKKNGL